MMGCINKKNCLFLFLSVLSLVLLCGCDGGITGLGNNTAIPPSWSEPKNIGYQNIFQNLDLSADGNGNAFLVGFQFAKRYIDGIGWYIDETEKINTAYPSGQFLYPQVVQNDIGDTCVFWANNDTGPVFGNIYNSSGNWQDVSHNNLNTGTYLVGTGLLPNDNNISADMDQNGNIVAAWKEVTLNSPYNPNINAVIYNAGSGWIKTEIPGSELGRVNSPKAFWLPDNKAIVVWLLSDAGYTNVSFYYSLYTPGSGWGNSTFIANITGHEFSPKLEAGKDPLGNVIVIKAFGNEIWALNYSTGSGWSVPNRIYSTSEWLNEGNDWRFRMNKNGIGWLVWRQGRNQIIDADDIIVKPFSFAHGWGPEQKIDNTVYPVYQPYIDVDQQGNAMAIWRQTDDDIQHHYLFGSYCPKGGPWQTPKQINKDLSEGILLYRLVADSKGRFIVAWVQEDNYGPPVQLSYWANRFE